MIKLGNFKSIICLNGDLPGADFFRSVMKANIPIIGVDGGAKKLLEIGINPNFIVGDMDTFNKDSGQASEVIIVEDQNYTDFEKAIVFAKARNLEPSLILGVNGGEIDHILNNIATFVRYSDDFDMWFYDIQSSGHEKVGRAAMNLEYQATNGATVSLFSFDEGKIETQGMVWEIESENFHIMQKSAARNRTKSEKIKVSTDGSKVLTIIDAKLIQ